jgi:aspartate/methionine/tyrosine aminotransferase
MDILARANELVEAGQDVAMLCVGQPAAPAPAPALEAARRALVDGRLGYTDAGGRRELREALSRHYSKTYGVEVAPNRVVVTTGSSAGFALSFLACLDCGARVGIARPGYPAYRNIIRALGMTAVEIETHFEDRHTVTPAMLDKAGPLDALLIASPANPTGTMLTPEALFEIVDWCQANGTQFISDEIYHGLTFPGAPRQATALERSDDAIIVNSFSKYYCMTGWRIGWLILPEKLVRPVERLGQSLYISAPDLSQIAATAALNDKAPALDAVKAQYETNRAMLMKRLPQLGFREIAPGDGAFYIYAKAPARVGDTMEFARTLLDEAKVAITPGLDFDLERGHETVRLSYAGSGAEVSTALDRLKAFLS